MSEGYYETAQICRNGHEITTCYESSPEHCQDYCSRCGAPTIKECPDCHSPIRGYYISLDVLFRSKYVVPSFCYNCGKPYPWTETKLQVAHELADELSELTSEEKETLKDSLDNIVTDSPKTTLATTRFKKLMHKAGSTVADSFRSIMVDIASETAKKILWPS